MGQEIKEQLNEIREHISETTVELKETVEKQQSEIKELGEAREETGQKVQKLNDRLEEQMAEFKERVSEVEKKAGRITPGDMSKEQKKTLGQLFVESDAYEKYDVGSGGTSSKFSVDESMEKFFTKQQITGSELNQVSAYLYQADRIADIIHGPEREDRIRDLLNVVPTNTGAIEYVEETGFENEASAWEEPDDEDEEVDEKSKSELVYEVKSVNVKTIAHWIPATRTIIEDAPQLRNAIDSRLVYGLQTEEDRQILYGSGASGQLQGITGHASVQTYNWSDGEEGDTRLDAIRRAMTKAMVAEYPVDGLLVSVEDWEKLELLKGNDGHYIWVTVSDGGEGRLWRANVVASNAIDENDFITGSFGMSANLYDRQQASVRISDSHDKFFTQNMYAILAEERLALAILRPEGFVVGEFDAEPTETE